MFGNSTKNVDAMKEATTSKKSKGFGNLEKVYKMNESEMAIYFGGNVKKTFEKKKGHAINRWFHGPSPCEGELPQ